MNILVAESSTTVGGQEHAVLLHAERLLKRGHRLRLILEPQSPIHRMALERRLPVEPVGMERWRYPLAISRFRQLLRRVTDPGICAAIRDDNPGEFSYEVNADYPKTKAVSTVPPSVIAVLPALPEDVYYRFLDRDLILHDLRANIILDRIDDAIRCND